MQRYAHHSFPFCSDLPAKSCTSALSLLSKQFSQRRGEKIKVGRGVFTRKKKKNQKRKALGFRLFLNSQFPRSHLIFFRFKHAGNYS